MLKSKVLLNDKLKLHKEPDKEHNNIPPPREKGNCWKEKKNVIYEINWFPFVDQSVLSLDSISHY